jgi:hypothetical protein
LPQAGHQDPIDAALQVEETRHSPEAAGKRHGPEANPSASRGGAEAPNGPPRQYASLLDDLPDTPRYPLWPFLLAILALSLILALQAGYHYRDSLSRDFPVAASLFKSLNIKVSLSRDAEWISIEDSDLQADPQTGHLKLQTTLRNSAAYVQAWPNLELTLTDAFDAKLARRIFTPEDYLSAGAPAAFMPGNFPVQLVLDAGDLPVSGYALYLFYP